MNINKSKVTLAAKIKSSGFEWPQFGKWATQDKDGEIFISGGDFTPVRMSGEVNWEFDSPYKSAGKVEVGLNWFQCILSRAEYLHLYPAPDADGWIEHDGKHEPEISTSGLTIWCKWSDGLEQSHEANMVDWIDDSDVRVVAYRLHKHEKSLGELCGEAKLAELVAACEALGAVLIAAGVEPESDVAKADAEAKPTIEQLTSDYRNAKDYAERKQQEADDAKADADARLKALELAGEGIGLIVSPITAKQEPELVIADWRDLRVGDEIEVFNFECPWGESSRKQELMSGPCVVMRAEDGNVRIELKKNLPTKGPHWNATGADACDFKFIRRP